MEPNSAAEHLQIIRTLMERSALYRRTLAPITLTVGVIGSGAAVAGWFWGLSTPTAFTGYWMAVGAVTLVAALLLARLQAIKDDEPFWSPPTRRVAQAFFPPMFLGLVVGLLTGLSRDSEFLEAWALPAVWMALYGCALHAAGFFMVRGIRLFGWVFILAGCILLACRVPAGVPSMAHIVMGGAFGGLHLAYGIYLYFTEQSRKST